MTVTVDTYLRPNRVALGIVLVLFSTFFTSLQDAIFKQASSDMSVWQLYVLRSLIVLPILLIIALRWGDGTATLKQSFQPWAMARSLLFVCMFMTIYASIPFIPLSTMAAGLYTAPLFIAMLSSLVIGEPVGWRGWSAIILGFAGVLVVLRPGTEAFAWMTLLPILGGLSYAFAALITRSKCGKVPPATLAVSLTIALMLTGIAASVVLYLWQMEPTQIATAPFLLGAWGKMGPFEWGLVAGLVLLMVGNGLVLPAAYQAAPAVIIATFDYSYLIFVSLMGFALFSEIPDLQSIIGMLMIAGAGLMVALSDPSRTTDGKNSSREQADQL